MEETAIYKVEITPEAEQFYYEILMYLYTYHSEMRADLKSAELLELAMSLDTNPYMDTKE